MKDDNDVWVPSHLVGTIRKRLATLIRKATKLGLPPPEITEIGTERRRTPAGFLQPHVGLRLAGRVPHVNGYTVLASLHAADAGNIIKKAFEGAPDLPEEFRQGIFCDHCKQSRRRERVYVLRHADGRMIRVGGVCLELYADEKSLELALEVAKLCNDIIELCHDLDRGGRDDGFGNGGATTLSPVRTVLALAAHATKKFGFRSRAKCDAEGGMPTSERVAEALHSKSFHVIEQDDWSTADEVIVWAMNLRDEAKRAGKALGEYMHNVHCVVAGGSVHPRDLGLLVSAVAAYQRELANRELAERVGAPQSLNAKIGTRLRGLKGTVLASRTFDRDSAWSSCCTVYDILTESGEVVTYYRDGTGIITSDNERVRERDSIVFDATIKKFGPRIIGGKSVPATVVTRLTVRQREAS